MIKERLKIVGAEYQTDEIMDICKKLWQNNFEDSDEYVHYYFSDRWKESITYLYGDKSMLHLNPYDMKLFGKRETIYYIVGVCTNKEYRHKGCMDFLLRNVFERLYNENAPFVYLMPASEKIYTPYGFRGMYGVTSFNVIRKEMYLDELYSKCAIRKFDELSENEKSELSGYASAKLENDFQCFVIRDREYFIHKDKEMQACGGSVLVLMEENMVKGYAMYICEEEPEIVEFVADDGYSDVFIEKVFQYADEQSENEGSNHKIIFDESYFVKEQNDSFAFFISEENIKNLLMARIVDIRAFVKMISFRDICEEYHIEIEDDIIEENNGRWDIELGERSLIREGESGEGLYQKMTIAAFGEMIFSKIKFYLNEMV